MGKTKTKNQKKSRLNAIRQGEEDFGKVPHSFVFHRGQIGKNAGQLVTDMRHVMEPFTAENLKVRKKNVLKDFAAVAGPLGVTHFMIFTKTPSSINMRLARLPKGPTMYFKLLKYTLVKDIVSSLKRHRMHQQQFTHHPLLVLNNFGSTGMQVKLMATMFQNMFPSISVHKVNLNSIKRCVLLNYDPLSEEIEFRHYSLKVVPVGMSRGVKKLMQERFPNMSRFDDISELLMKGANLSESEAEQDGDHNITELPQAYSGRGNMCSQQSAVRLTEIGPRMTMKLVKIEEGMGAGNVLYHSFIQKSEEDIREILKRKEAQLKLKQERKKKQEQNILHKKEKREENKKKSLAGIKRKHQDQEGATDSEVEDPGQQDDQAAAESEDEAEYYRQAVGEEPDEGMFPMAKKKQNADKSLRPFKKRKMSVGKDSGQGGAPKRGRRAGGGPSPKRSSRPGTKARPQNQDRKQSKKGVKNFGVKKGERGLKLKRQNGNPRPGFKKGGKQGFRQKKGKGRP
ncbi:suppressor of SWI4 1 homolog [Paramormyrops kingsleyae]|uniref:Suppressor of SWI4 1 homolog n=1 Tax=Paramormyrops kingsleyae TaxID=1676925 RepID=A0A3B3T314_9TELE|nr:suppressor of SWI4 1 homolog [Paramormyrops kingsleyae]